MTFLGPNGTGEISTIDMIDPRRIRHTASRTYAIMRDPIESRQLTPGCQT
jgi:hypothetical protein